MAPLIKNATGRPVIARFPSMGLALHRSTQAAGIRLYHISRGAHSCYLRRAPGVSSTLEWRKDLMAIKGWKFTHQEIAEEMGIEPERLLYMAQAGYAPCVLNEKGLPFFKKKDIESWVMRNMYTEQEGKEVPFRIVIFQKHEIAPDGPVPEELISIEGLQEFIQPILPPCVYFLIRENEVVYVGQSVHGPGARCWQHKKDKDFDRCFFMSIPEHRLRDVEKQFRLTLIPEYNTEVDTMMAKQMSMKQRRTLIALHRTSKGDTP